MSFGIVLETQSTLSVWAHADFLALLAVSVLGTIYFGSRAWAAHIERKKEIERIKAGDVISFRASLVFTNPVNTPHEPRRL
jgi:hypothetical protein